MADTILVVEQREGKLNRVSWETITAGQAIAAATGWTLEAAVVGASSDRRRSGREEGGEGLRRRIAEARALHARCVLRGAQAIIAAKQPKLVLMPHTYQVRDFVPKLATAMGRAAISDCIGFNMKTASCVFTRQMFQGKFAADVSFACDAPWFVTFQNGAFRGDKAEAGAQRGAG